jgi:hypothetical protein
VSAAISSGEHTRFARWLWQLAKTNFHSKASALRIADLPNRGRRYFRDFIGRASGRARYIKEVDADEKTTRFAQEIYDAAGRLTAVHEKFPVDLGHQQA